MVHADFIHNPIDLVELRRDMPCSIRSQSRAATRARTTPAAVRHTLRFTGMLQGPISLDTTLDASGTDVMTVDEAAEFLRVGRNALYDAIGCGDVPHRRIGKTIRLSRAALVRWLGRSCGAASTQGQ